MRIVSPKSFRGQFMCLKKSKMSGREGAKGKW